MFFVVLPVIFSRSSDSSHIIPPYKPFVKHFFIGVYGRQRPPSTMSSTDLIVSKTSLSVFNPQIAFDVLLGQHRIMGQGDSVRDFDASESMKNAGILDVFPIFHTARLWQKIR